MFIFSTGLFFLWPWKEKKQNGTSTLPTSRDETKKYDDSNKELLQTLGLNNGTAWKR